MSKPSTVDWWCFDCERTVTEERIMRVSDRGAAAGFCNAEEALAADLESSRRIGEIRREVPQARRPKLVR